MSDFRTSDRENWFLLLPQVQEWLLEANLAQSIGEVIDGLNLGGMSRAYRGSSLGHYFSWMLLGPLAYDCPTGVSSSGKFEWATYDSFAYRFIAGNEHAEIGRGGNAT